MKPMTITKLQDEVHAMTSIDAPRPFVEEPARRRIADNYGQHSQFILRLAATE